MPSLVEEILLLSLDDASGSFLKLPEYSLELATSGAVLMDLALRDRIDADLERLMVVRDEPTGEPVLDAVLREIARAPDAHDLRGWLLQLAWVRFVRERALERLVERGILRREDKRLLWVFGSRRYPVVDDQEQREAKLRILEILRGGAIPDPRDVILISLGHACSLFKSILGKGELKALAPRIEDVARMDLIGSQMLEELRELHASLNTLGWWGVGEAPALESRIRAAYEAQA